ncbi:hypothetical protein B4158_3040 [Bacillus cereus]|nr:hypothetical protein B4158_3040 [Bacillus cereus]
MKKYLLGQWYVGHNNMVWYGMNAINIKKNYILVIGVLKVEQL